MKYVSTHRSGQRSIRGCCGSKLERFSFLPPMETLRAVLAWLRADRATLPTAAPASERVALLVLALSTAWFALAAAWEIAAPFAAGHYAAATAVATGGENIWRWGVLGAVPHDTADPPLAGDFYCHHPWGVFWTAALFVGTFGHHDWVCRLPAVLISASMPGLIYASGRALWGPIAGAASALAFTVVPIALAFANFFALEVPVMFGVALCIWGSVRLTQSGRRRWLVLALFGLTFALHADWAAFVFAAFVLAALFPRIFLLRRWFPPLPLRRLSALWVMAAGLCVASAAFYLIAFASLGQLEEFMHQGELRSVGVAVPLGEALAARKTWIETSFTPLAIALGKLAAPLLALRFVLLRREGELLPLCVLGMAVVQYVVFKQGADIHFFWPHYFALYFAFALGALTRTLESGLTRLSELLRRPRLGRAAAFFSLGVAALVSLAMAPDALRALVYARKTGGRFNEKGSIIQPDIDKAAAFEFVAPRVSGLIVNSGMKYSYWMNWALQKPLKSSRLPRGGGQSGERYFMLDARFSSSDDLAAVLHNYSPELIGPFWFVDRQKPRAALAAHRIARREPSLWESYFVVGSHALRQIEPDPWLAWEAIDHFGEGAAPTPHAPPVDSEALRAAHNQALATGDAARAEALLQKLLRGTDQSARCRYSDGSELLGVRFERGATDVLSVYLRAGGVHADGCRFGIESIVEAPPPWSLVPADPVQRDVGMPPMIAPASWKAGYVYSTVTELMKRPGRERFVGGFRGPGAPAPEGCSPEQTLLVLED